MSYQALLFCPDEKTARVVSQVLSELEFSVEPCHEPFAAVKKLMVQHFDAIVVDCDNEQNAALLFKSARNSGSNQASLAVAVVEGQAGVAKAFRLGANLVLTKPIHVEQSKGTLRVARGLLRKGQAVKAAAAVPGVSTLVPQRIAPAAFPPAPAPPTQSASAFELDAEPMPSPDPADAALLEYMPDSPVSSAPNSPRSAAESDPSKQYPWQPRKPLAEPMASALRKAAEAAGKSEFDAAAPRSTVAPQAGIPQAGPAQFPAQLGTAELGIAQGKTGAAAAPARAREIPAPDAKKLSSEPTASALVVPSVEEIKRIEDPSASDGWDTNPTAVSSEAPSFSSLDEPQAADPGGSKKTGLIAVLLIGLAAAGYFGWTKMRSAPTEPSAAQSTSFPVAVTPAPPAQAPASATETQSAPVGDVVAPQPESGLSGTTVVTATSKPSAAVIAEGPGNKMTAPAKSATTDDEITVVKSPPTAPAEPAAVLKVQNGTSTQPKTAPEAQESEQAPEVNSIATGSSSAVSGIVNTDVINAQKPAPQLLKISQGVSQGLIIKKVQPVYPAQAKQMHLEGRVELQANVTPAGSISAVKQLSGDPILGRAAVEAVRQWKYKPYYLNGEPVEVETQITVNFKLP
jgi:periplasmic protein TonB